jgi:hypothetical protein
MLRRLPEIGLRLASRFAGRNWRGGRLVRSGNEKCEDFGVSVDMASSH